MGIRGAARERGSFVANDSRDLARRAAKVLPRTGGRPDRQAREVPRIDPTEGGLGLGVAGARRPAHGWVLRDVGASDLPYDSSDPEQAGREADAESDDQSEHRLFESK